MESINSKLNANSARFWWRLPVINRRAWTWEDTNSHIHCGQWWQHAVIYQIFPQSFCDASGDGIGDIKGIIEKLDYIAALGVEAIWLNPIYPSTHEDAGYDVTKLTDVDPRFGYLGDFKRLLELAHLRGLKVILDQVWNHTSSAHPWFQESKKNRSNNKADWYVWADAKPDGSPPNNWISAFTGENAWIWEEEREQFYLANFMPSQPDLNWHHSEMIRTLLNQSQFWLELGVDGFRIDAVNFFVHDRKLRDNPQRGENDAEPDGIAADNPLAKQKFCNSFCRPETLEKLTYVRQLMERYPGTVTLGEVTLCEDSIELSGQYVKDNDRLHLAYNSALLEDEPLSAPMLHDIMKKTLKHFPEGGQCWMVGNHDYQRLRSRWTGHKSNGEPYSKEFYRMVIGLLVTLPGALCLYQGDELGLPLGKVPDDIDREDMQDPYGKCMYPKDLGRDGSRTPMPWQSCRSFLGFTSADSSWLPIPDSHKTLAVDIQNGDPDSLLNTWRRMLIWRRAQPAIISGDVVLHDPHPDVFAYTRRYAEQTLLCVFNVSDKATEYPTNFPHEYQQAHTHTVILNQDQFQYQNQHLLLQPYGAVYISHTEV